MSSINKTPSPNPSNPIDKVYNQIFYAQEKQCESYQKRKYTQAIKINYKKIDTRHLIKSHNRKIVQNNLFNNYNKHGF